VPNPNDEDNESVVFFPENDPITPDFQTIERIAGFGYAPDVILQRLRILGQDEEFGFDDLLMGAIDLPEIIQGLAEKPELEQS
jgi:hypothetical protein